MSVGLRFREERDYDREIEFLCIVYVVLDRDYFTVPESEAWKVQPVMTGLNGRIVQDRGKLAGTN
ncbi:MAG: hypothetical protein HYX74_01935 [Acidobacteria bacterium]|nr:hypothetical protein [Acidobacteriota bacterium]